QASCLPSPRCQTDSILTGSQGNCNPVIELLFYRSIPVGRQPQGGYAAAALRVANLQGTVVGLHDLLAHRQANAGSPGLGGTFVELVFDKGQLLLRHTGTVVPDANDHIVPLRPDGHVHPAAGAAVL